MCTSRRSQEPVCRDFRHCLRPLPCMGAMFSASMGGGECGIAQVRAEPRNLWLPQDVLITKPRTSHCWYGLYFDVEAKDKPVIVSEILSGCSSGAEGTPLEVQVWKCDRGSFKGHEEVRWPLSAAPLWQLWGIGVQMWRSVS